MLDLHSRDFIISIHEEKDMDRLREVLQIVEDEIKHNTYNESMLFNFRGMDKYTLRKIEDLIGTRQLILNKMFQATPAEVERFKIVNTLLKQLTEQMYQRTADFYRTLLKYGKDATFDDDYNVEGSLQYAYNGEDSILCLEEDPYYGSDFNYMIDLIDSFIYQTHYYSHEINSVSIVYKLEHTPDWTNEQLDCLDPFDDGQSWTEGWLRHPNLDSICMCYAVHDLCTHKDYSIPDFLRLNDFWVEAKVVCQHIVEQDGTRYDPFKET